MSDKIRQRILSRSIPEPNSGCWLWLGYDNGAGYGLLGIDGGQVYAHRASYAAFKGAIFPGLVVCHKCDVRCCVNPDHLFLGTQKDNVQDCILKGRRAYCFGEEAPSAKLTPEKARAIFLDSRIQYDIAAEYGVNQSCVSRIKNRLDWTRATAGLSA